MNRIAERRKELGLTQPDLAAILRSADPRIDTGMVCRFERDVCVPTESVMLALETALQAPRSVLYDEMGLLTTPLDKMGEMGELTLLIANTIPRGRDNAISRQDLASRIGMGDRDMRAAIQRAREEGLPVVNDQDGRGYYIAVTDDEARRQIKRNEARAMAILKQNKFLRRIVNG